MIITRDFDAKIGTKAYKDDSKSMRAFWGQGIGMKEKIA